MPCAYPEVVWYPEHADPELVDSLLSLTLANVADYCLPQNVILVLDGQERWQEAVKARAKAHGFRYHYLPTNLGKGGAIAAGIEALQDVAYRFLVIRDSDGDHLIHDMPSLLGLAEQMAAETGSHPIIVSGGRTDRTRPLGFERAQYESITDRVLWQALQYHAAREGRCLSGAYFATYGDWPDLQSGYKVYSAAAARTAHEVLSGACREGPDGGLARCGVETLPAVHILSAGGEIGVTARRTYQEQPVSGYRGLDVLRMYAEPLLWSFRFLGVPAPAAATMLDDALLRSPLLFDPLRREKALEVRSAILRGLGAEQPLISGPRHF